VRQIGVRIREQGRVKFWDVVGSAIISLEK
jgi:hypothetical protein